MYLKLRIFFTILSALCLAFALTAGAIWGYIWAIVLGLAAVLFFLLMKIFKQAQESQEEKKAEEEKFFTSSSPTSTPDPADTKTDKADTL